MERLRNAIFMLAPVVWTCVALMVLARYVPGLWTVPGTEFPKLIPLVAQLAVLQKEEAKVKVLDKNQALNFFQPWRKPGVNATWQTGPKAKKTEFLVACHKTNQWVVPLYLAGTGKILATSGAYSGSCRELSVASANASWSVNRLCPGFDVVGLSSSRDRFFSNLGAAPLLTILPSMDLSITQDVFAEFTLSMEAWRGFAGHGRVISFIRSVPRDVEKGCDRLKVLAGELGGMIVSPPPPASIILDFGGLNFCPRPETLRQLKNALLSRGVQVPARIENTRVSWLQLAPATLDPGIGSDATEFYSDPSSAGSVYKSCSKSLQRGMLLFYVTLGPELCDTIPSVEFADFGAEFHNAISTLGYTLSTIPAFLFVHIRPGKQGEQSSYKTSLRALPRLARQFGIDIVVVVSDKPWARFFPFPNCDGQLVEFGGRFISSLAIAPGEPTLSSGWILQIIETQGHLSTISPVPLRFFSGSPVPYIAKSCIQQD